jgi:hypothetical protein
VNDDTVVTLHPLHFGAEEDGEREVGRVDTGVFVALPTEGVVLLELLSTGLSVAQVRGRFAERFGTEPDLEEFLEGIGECGFVAAVDGQTTGPAPAEQAATGGLRLLGNVPSHRVAWLLAPPMRVLYWAIWVAAPVLVLFEPELLPQPSDALVFDQVLASSLFLAVVGWTLLLCHECAHAIVARALGCTGWLSISRRLYFLVAQTDVSGVRAAPRNRRYAAFLAGMTWDMAVVVGCLVVQLAGGAGQQLVRAVVYMLALALLFQFLVFMRTDVYYVLANWLRLGNLMEDTRHVVANAVRRAIGRPPSHDLSAVPERELRVIRWYAPFYLLGSAAAITAYGVLMIPALLPFLGIALTGVADGPGSAGFWDGAGFLLLVISQFAALGWVALRERRQRGQRTVLSGSVP